MGADRDVNLFQLTSHPEDGAIDLLPEVFVEQRHVHILGIGPVFCLRNEMGPSGWCVPLSTSGQRHNSKDGGIEQMPSTVEMNASALGTELYLGGGQNVATSLCNAGDSQILKVIGDSEYPPLVPGEKQASSSKSIQVIPRPSLPPTSRLEIQPTTGPPSSNKSTQSKPTSR